MSTPRQQTSGSSMDFAPIFEWLAGVDLGDHPDVDVRARWLLLDTVACMAVGFRYPEPAAFLSRLHKGMSGPVLWPGAHRAVNPLAAASAGAMAACWIEACEGLARAHGRPGLHSVPVAAAIAADARSTIKDLLTAIVWGYEIGGRAGEAMRIASGLHVDGTWGLLASTAAAARALGLGSELCHNAVAAAACQIPGSLYAPIRSGETARNTYAAHAAAQGIILAESAAAGVTAPPDVFAQAAAQLGRREVSDDAPAWTPPGSFLTLQGYFKRYAGVRHTHYAVEAALRWRAENGADTSRIRRITVITYPEALTYCGVRAPRTLLQAQFSLSYALAHALCTGSLSANAYSAESLLDVEQQRLESLVRFEADPTIIGRAASVRIETADSSWDCLVAAVAGDPDMPFSQDDLRQKAMEFLGYRMDAGAAAELIDYVLESPSCSPFTLRHGHREQW